MGAAAVHFLRRVALVAIGYKAKVLGSAVFVSGRTPESVLSEDLSLEQMWIVRRVNARVDFASRSVTASLFGLLQRKVIFRPALGCTLLPGPTQYPLKTGSDSKPFEDANVRWDALWPQGERVDLEPLPHAVDEVSLERVVADAFHDPDPRRPCRTRAVAIVHAGRIVAECYAPGFPLHMPLIGWSMAKSVVNALVGILVRQGRLALHHDRLLPEWCQPGDGRAKITLGQLLRMNSGLAFSENYRNPLDGVLPMLFNSADGGSYAAEKPLCVEPGSQWYYSSGTTSILCRVLRDALAGSDEEYQTFPRRALFDRIGMSTAVLEPDASGTFVGSSFMYASARDWARLGLLYLQDGVWHGERILPEGWVDYSRGCGQSERGRYGAHFWLELPAFGRTTEKPRAILPRDAFHAVGYEGQYLSIIPSMKLVVVRLGLTPRMEAWNHERFLARIVRSIA